MDFIFASYSQRLAVFFLKNVNLITLVILKIAM